MPQTAQYDHIGSKYDEYAQTATLLSPTDFVVDEESVQTIR